jgi:hypothetical protein
MALDKYALITNRQFVELQCTTAALHVERASGSSAITWDHKVHWPLYEKAVKWDYMIVKYAARRMCPRGRIRQTIP